MDGVQPSDEPSLKEILASIKQVIERDRERTAGESPGGHEAVEPALEEEATDVLDLGEAGVLLDQGEPSENARSDDVHSDEGREASVAEAALAGSDAAARIRHSLAALELLARPDATRIAAADELSLEALTRAMLRPMLADWLDANMPAIVERLVQAEIARILGRTD